MSDPTAPTAPRCGERISALDFMVACHEAEVIDETTLLRILRLDERPAPVRAYWLDRIYPEKDHPLHG